ncbi:unnamed protein product [Lasius platythorax]|uniref:BZIP domain-containing protein n=1 Tax=Lasius platythorax TaxID=488582 RepID=A0AAV2P095_9HYME
MVNPAYRQTIRKKRKHRAGKQTRANRADKRARAIQRASNLIWVNRQTFGTQSYADSTDKFSLTPATSAFTTQSEILIGSPQEISNSKVELNTKIIDNFSIELPILNDSNDLKPNSPEFTTCKEYQKENSEVNQTKILPKDLISQLKSQLSEDKHFSIDQYAQYLDL